MKKQVLITFCLCLATIVSAQNTISLESIVSAEVASELRSEGKVQYISYKDRKYEAQLKPTTALAEETTNVWQARRRPVFVAESLYLINKNNPTDAGSDIPFIAKTLTSLSTMQGLEYVNSDGETASLYKEIYTVNNLEEKEKIADNNEGNSDGKLIHTYQKMATFGTGYYEYTFKQNATEVMCSSKNIDYITYRVFRLVNPGSFRMSFVVIDLGDSLLMYNLAEAEFFAISAVEKRMTQAFIRRADAIYNWLDAAYAAYSETK